MKLTPMKWFVILVVIACILVLALPPDPATLRLYHLSSLAYRLVILTLLLPYIVIWYAGFYAFAKLSEYSRYLKGAKEDQAIKKITVGMGVLAFGLIIPTIISSILNEIAAQSHGFKPAAVIVNHYISLLVPLAAFTYMSTGSRKLAETVRVKPTLNGARLFAIIFIILAALFTQLAIREHYVNGNPYYLGVYLLIFTIVIPYLYSWFLGLLSAYDFRLYAAGVKGVLYKKAFSQFSLGIAVTILGFIAIQFVTSVYGNRTDKSLGFILVLIYILLAILVTGLSLMALGTKKLKKIEEV